MSKHKGLGRGLDALLGGNAKARSDDSDLMQLAREYDAEAVRLEPDGESSMPEAG